MQEGFHLKSMLKSKLLKDYNGLLMSAHLKITICSTRLYEEQTEENKYRCKTHLLLCDNMTQGALTWYQLVKKFPCCKEHDVTHIYCHAAILPTGYSLEVFKVSKERAANLVNSPVISETLGDLYVKVYCSDRKSVV